MLNKNRKGVSEVVANVLIVLLVIVGIAVIWSVVKPTVDRGAAGIKTGSECLSISLEPVSCVAVPTTTACGTFVNSPSVCTEVGCLYTAAVVSPATPATCMGTVSSNVKLVTIKRNTGSGTFDSAVLVFGDGTSSASVPAAVTSTSLGELSTTTLYKVMSPSVALSTLTPKTVNVAARIEGQLCPPLSVPVNCV